MKQGVFKVIPVSSPQANLLHKKPFYSKFFLVIVTLVVESVSQTKNYMVGLNGLVRVLDLSMAVVAL